MRSFISVLGALTWAISGCGDDSASSPDATVNNPSDANVDATPPGAPTPFAISLSGTGQDQLMAAQAGPGGSFYVAGFSAMGVNAPKHLVVAKILPTGALDPSFAASGVFTSTVVFAGGTDEIDMVVQSTGKLVVAATIASLGNPSDRDIGLLRVDEGGNLDTGFGDGGLVRLDLNTALAQGAMLVAPDLQRGLALGPNDALFVHASSRAVGNAAAGGPRTDSDFTVAKLSAAGIRDAAWADGGVFRLDFAGTSAEANGTPRQIHALADGSVIAGGYANTAAFNKVQAVLFRLTPGGDLDTGFGGGTGFFYDVVLAEQTEIYGFAVDGNQVTTGGYGREAAAGTNDFLSLRFDAVTGVRNPTFGGAANGAVIVDPSGAMHADNCRGAIGIGGGRTVLFGSAGAAGIRDAALVPLTRDGLLDTAFGINAHTFSLGGGEDQFWAGAVSGGKLLVVGWRGQTEQTEASNDDSFGVLFTIE